MTNQGVGQPSTRNPTNNISGIGDQSVKELEDNVLDTAIHTSPTYVDKQRQDVPEIECIRGEVGSPIIISTGDSSEGVVHGIALHLTVQHDIFCVRS